MLGSPPCRFCHDTGWLPQVISESPPPPGYTGSPGEEPTPCFCNPRGLSTAEYQALAAETIRRGRCGSRTAGVYRGSAVKTVDQLIALTNAGTLNLQAKE